MKTIKVRSTGVVTVVSDAYFEAYQPGGWFFEVQEEVKAAKVVKEPKVTKSTKTVEE